MPESETPFPRRLSQDPQDPPGCRPPARSLHRGARVDLEPLDPARHGDDLYALSHGEGADPALWDYLPYGPFPARGDFDTWLAAGAASGDPLFFAIRDKASGRTAGVVSYLNIVPAHGSIEIGHIWMTAPIQRRPPATEAIFLAMARAFDEAGYRRLEWKCNAMNARSRAAVRRFGFRFEGIFYRHMVVRGRNRDTAWYALLAEDWPGIRRAFETWLDPANFDDGGRQRVSLAALTAAPEDDGE